MFRADQYDLLDFGQGRKLERFGELVVDRPAPAATDMAISNSALWTAVDARFTRRDAASGSWMLREPVPHALVRAPRRLHAATQAERLRCDWHISRAG